MARRLAAPVVLVLALLAAAAAPARAETVVVVLDRGEAAREEATRWDETAVALVEGLRARGDEVRFLVYGTRTSGRARVGAVRGEPAEALAEDGDRPGWRHEGPTTLEQALGWAVAEGARPDRVLLVGPFAGEPDDEATVPEPWAPDAAAPPALGALGLAPPAATRLADVPGWQPDLAVVRAVGRPRAEPAPFSPFAPPEVALEATLAVDLDVLGGPPAEALLEARSALAGDRVERAPDAAPGRPRFRLRRDPAAGRTATVSFRPRGEAPHLWLVEPPAPITFRWRTLAPDARLRDADGTPPRPFTARGVRVGQPHVARYRVESTRAGPPPAFAAAPRDGAMPPGLSVHWGDTVVLDEDRVATMLRVVLEAAPARPVDARGTLVIAAPDHPARLALDYDVRVPPGRARVALVAEKPLRVPLGEEPALPRLRVEADENVGATVPLRLRLAPTPADDAVRLALVAEDGQRSVAPGDVVELARDASVALALELAVGVGAPWPGAADGAPLRVTLEAAAAEGLEVEVDGEVQAVLRRPRLVDLEPAARYRVEDGAVVGSPPLVLGLDDDGMTGRHRLHLLETTPTLEVREGPGLWRLRSTAPGRWEIVADDGWATPDAAPFAAREAPLRFAVTWEAGAAPPPMATTLEVPPRWGAAGWVLVLLAALAILLGLFIVAQMRAPPLAGTLLWTCEDLPGTVGRLELDGTRRRRLAVRADRSGRLHLGDEGAIVARVRSSRVGPLLEDDEGGDRRLLVDGLTVARGRHRLAYVTGTPGDDEAPRVRTEVPDLLGPDHDLATGRIDALAPETEQEAAPETDRDEEGGAPAGPARS